MKITAMRNISSLLILGAEVFMTGCASDFGKACTKFFSP